jgi:two-component system sensor histidine kinase UhpB
MRLENEERERRRTEEALRESEQRFRLAFDHAPIGMTLVAPDGRFLQVNRALCELLGYTEQELLDRTFQVITHPDDLDADLALVRQVLAGEIERYSMEKRYFHKQGHVVWILLHVSLVRDDGGEPLYFVSQIKDITEARRAEAERERLLAEVSSARQRLETLSRRLVTVQEEERRTIARELHDEVGQILAGLRLMMETSSRPGAVVDLAALEEVAARLLERVKDLSLDLRPPMLDDLGLVPTLLWHFQRYRAQTGIEVRFHHRGANRRFPPPTEISAFRIIQEALTNVARHAGAADVDVEVWADDPRLVLRVEDEGSGFDPEAPSGLSSGLTGMRERARLVGGTLTLETRLGAGTRIEAELPLPDGAEAGS